MMELNELKNIGTHKHIKWKMSSIAFKQSVTDSAFDLLPLAVETEAMRAGMTHLATFITADTESAHD